jgi:hypothetical protein
VTDEGTQQLEAPGTSADKVAGLHRALGTLDIVLLNIAAIISFRWLSVAEQIGPS